MTSSNSGLIGPLYGIDAVGKYTTLEQNERYEVQNLHQRANLPASDDVVAEFLSSEGEEYREHEQSNEFLVSFITGHF